MWATTSAARARHTTKKKTTAHRPGLHNGVTPETASTDSWCRGYVYVHHARAAPQGRQLRHTQSARRWRHLRAASGRCLHVVWPRRVEAERRRRPSRRRLTNQSWAWMTADWTVACISEWVLLVGSHVKRTGATLSAPSTRGLRLANKSVHTKRWFRVSRRY